MLIGESSLGLDKKLFTRMEDKLMFDRYYDVGKKMRKLECYNRLLETEN